jgi:tRNA threonylcarbamoyladenosine biosynthesis protein TsaB
MTPQEGKVFAYRYCRKLHFHPMTLILAIETSTSLTSVALLTPQGIPVREDAGAQHKASDLVMRLIDELLCEQGMSKRELQAVAYGCGPGAFTGLRTACAVAQGIAFGLHIPTIGITSMAAIAELAYAQHQHTRVMAVMDARMNEVYAQALQRDEQGVWHGVGSIEVTPVSHMHWPDETHEWQGAGNAWHSEDLKQQLQAATPAHVQMPRLATVPHAREVAALAAQGRAHQAMTASLSSMMAEPIYVRDRVAQTTAERTAAKAGLAV